MFGQPSSTTTKYLDIATPIIRETAKRLVDGWESSSSSYSQPLELDLSSENITNVKAGQGVCYLNPSIKLEEIVLNYSSYSAVIPISAHVKLLDYQDCNYGAMIRYQNNILTTKDVYLYLYAGQFSLQGQVMSAIDHTFTKPLSTIKYQVILNCMCIY